jgi:hypothetical protein
MLRQSIDALMGLIVRRWPGGGWVVELPWRMAGYQDGRQVDSIGAPPSQWHFAEREDAVAAVWLATFIIPEDR